MTFFRKIGIIHKFLSLGIDLETQFSSLGFFDEVSVSDFDQVSVSQFQSRLHLWSLLGFDLMCVLMYITSV